VVVTSSVAAIVGTFSSFLFAKGVFLYFCSLSIYSFHPNTGKPQEGHKFTEEDWNRSSTVDFEPYRYSKRVAEEAAWEFAKETGVSVVTVNPALVLGPPLSSRVDSFSVNVVRGFLEGKFKATGAKPSCFGCVDVRDVAEAHVRAATTPEAKGRYMVTSESGISQFELAQMLKRNGFEKYPLPDFEESPVTHVPLFDTKKVRQELGLEFTPIEKSVTDMAQALIDLKIVAPISN